MEDQTKYGKKVANGQLWEPVLDIANLKEGEIIRNEASGNRYIVTSNYGDRVTAVATVDVTNANEWEVLK